MTPGTTTGAGIRLSALRELWIHTGTACNLSCPFCHEGSQPGDSRLGAVTLAQLRPQLDAAAAAGVACFAFTGGEPLILKDIVAILRYCLALRPCLVLTNGTAPLIRRPQHLAQLQGLAYPLRFRVSIDYPDEARHDAGRGYKNFRKALQGLRLLSEAGFDVAVTRLQDVAEDAKSTASRYRQLLRKVGLREDLQIVALPDLGALRSVDPPHDPVPLALGAPATAANRIAPPACSRSRMLFLRGGALGYGPCPLVDDDPQFDLGPDLGKALSTPVLPRHRRCRQCHGVGVDYIGEFT